MKPRIEKKLSKKLAEILNSVRGFTPKDVWIDQELELHQVYYAYKNEKPLSPKQKRANYQQRVRVNGMPSIGGGLDYWGECQDWNSVLYCAREFLIWTMFDISPFDEKTCHGGYPIVNMRLTGKNVIFLARKYVESKP